MRLGSMVLMSSGASFIAEWKIRQGVEEDANVAYLV